MSCGKVQNDLCGERREPGQRSVLIIVRAFVMTETLLHNS